MCHDRWVRKFQYTIGIDEVGRGPLAGPVCVCALALSKENEKKLKIESKKRKLADSKKLSPLQREAWASWRRREKIPYALAMIPAKSIDKIHIHHAVNKAAQRAYEKIITKGIGHEASVIADGSIRVIPKKGHVFKNFPKADELVGAVSLASIIAKLHRDAYMERLHKKYPAYDFYSNKGYGTKKHIRAIRKNGPSAQHRLTFIKKYSNLDI